MDNAIMPFVMFAELMNLRMTVVAGGNAVISTGGPDLLIFHLPVSQTFLFEARLEKSATAAATVVVGTVGLHVNEVLSTNNGFHNKTQVVGNGIAIAFSDNLAGILYREFNFQVFVPVGTGFKPTFTDPFCIIFVNVFNF
jgi:hypothetical protein